MKFLGLSAILLLHLSSPPAPAVSATKLHQSSSTRASPLSILTGVEDFKNEIIEKFDRDDDGEISLEEWTDAVVE